MSIKSKEKREKIWLSYMAKAPTRTENPKTQSDNTKPPPKTTITQGDCEQTKDSQLE